MKRTVWIWELMGFAVTSIGGTVLHFLYEWSGESMWIAPFSGVNESTWEHMKLLFWPMLAFALFERLFFGGYDCYFCVKRRGIFLGLFLIPNLFYMYNGIIGKSPDFINIAIFFIAAGISYFYETRLFRDDGKDCGGNNSALISLLIVGFLFVLFTFKTPKLEIFNDPVTGRYGI